MLVGISTFTAMANLIFHNLLQKTSCTQNIEELQIPSTLFNNPNSMNVPLGLLHWSIEVQNK